MDARSDPSKLKFHGKLETTVDCFTEYDKEDLLIDIKEKLAYYSLHTFFDMPTAAGKMKNLILNYHLSVLDEIIKEYESRLINPDPVLEANHCETKDSIQADSVHMMHADFLIEPYPVWLLNLSCRSIL